MGRTELCGGVYTAQRQILTQILIGFFGYVLVYLTFILKQDLTIGPIL